MIDLLSVAQRDLDALEGWQAVVQAGRNEFVTRYIREYLTARSSAASTRRWCG